MGFVRGEVDMETVAPLMVESIRQVMSKQTLTET